MNRRLFTKLLSSSVIALLGLIVVEGCVVHPIDPHGSTPGRRRRVARRIRRRTRRRIRRRMVGGAVVFVVPKQIVVGDDIELDDGSIGVVNKIDGKNIEIETQGQIKSMTVEFE